MTKEAFVIFRKSSRHQYEDSFHVGFHLDTFYVADGVTRSVEAGALYPPDSPAAAVAQQCVTEMSAAQLTQLRTEQGMYNSFVAANEHMRRLNVSLGLWENHDYWTRDLAGAVAAALVLQSDRATWGYLTDCGVGHLTPTDFWRTPDLLAPVRRNFPRFDDPTQRAQYIRGQRRNRPERERNPKSRRPPQYTFGVLTGEDNAVYYIRTGERLFATGRNVFVVFTDGGGAFLECPRFRTSLLTESAVDLQEMMDSLAAQEPGFYSDDATLIVVRFTV